MRYPIALEPVEGGFGIQVPDLAVSAFAATAEEAKRIAARAIAANLQAYRDEGRQPPEPRLAEIHLQDPDMEDLLFAYVEVELPSDKIAA